jgi:hypothetical protein
MAGEGVVVRNAGVVMEGVMVVKGGRRCEEMRRRRDRGVEVVKRVARIRTAREVRKIKRADRLWVLGGRGGSSSFNLLTDDMQVAIATVGLCTNIFVRKC